MSGERAALPDAGADVARNRALWTIVNAQFTERDASRAWAADEVTWGLFGIPDRDLGALGDVGGLDVIELGCGTAYLSARLLRPGGRLVFLSDQQRPGHPVRPRAGGRCPGAPPAPATGPGPAGVAGRRGRVPSQPRRLDPRAARQRLRGRGPPRAVRPAQAETHPYYGIATAEWARQWPVEDLWAARLTRGRRS